MEYSLCAIEQNRTMNRAIKNIHTNHSVRARRHDQVAFSFLRLCWVGSGLIYIDRHTLEFDKKFTNWTLSYTLGRDRNSVNNFTLQTFTTITKILIYFTCCVAEGSNDKEYRREVVRTVIDLGKLFKGFQGNPLLKGGIENLRTGLKSEFTFPLPPVWSLKIY